MDESVVAKATAHWTKARSPAGHGVDRSDSMPPLDAPARSPDQLAVEGVAAGAVLDLDDPQVGVALDGARDIGVGLGLRHQLAGERGEPAEPAVEIAGLSQDAAATLQQVEL